MVKKILIVVMCGFAAVALFVTTWGFVTEAHEEGYGDEGLCSDECERGYYGAYYRYLVCRYPRLGQKDGYQKFLISGWQGDTEIEGARMADGKPFPPPLPRYRWLNEEEIAKVKGGSAIEVCPFFYDPHYGTTEKFEQGRTIVTINQ